MTRTAIPRNRQVNRFPAALVGALGIAPLIITVDIASFLRPDEFYLVALTGGLAFACFAAGVWFWLRPARSGAWIEFTKTGFSLGLKRSWRGETIYDLESDDIRELRGYGARLLELLLTNGASVRIGLILPSTKEDAPDLLVRRKLTMTMRLFEPDATEVMEHLTSAAQDAGYAVEKSKTRHLLVTSVHRWSVTKR